MTRACWIKTGILAAVLMAAVPAFAQDAVTAGPNVYKKLMENDRIRVLEATFKPGDKVGPHSVSEHLFYMLSGGNLTIKPEGRTAYEMTFKVGESLYLPAQTRAAENDGDQTVRALIVEIKGASARSGRRTGGKRGGRGKRRR